MTRFARLFSVALLLLAPIAASAQVIANPTTIAQFCVDRTVTPWVIGHVRKDGKCVGAETQDPVTGAVGMTPSTANIVGPAGILALPSGNTYPTFVGLNAAVTSVLPFGYPAQPGQTRRSSREWAAVFTMIDKTGGYPYPLGSPQSLADPSDKVALYAGMDCQAGGGPCWTINSSLDIEAGFSTLGHGATGYELDIGNFDVDSGGGDGKAGLVEPGYYGMTMAGIGKAVSAAISFGGPGDHAIFHRGVVDNNNAIDQCFICEYGVAYRVVDARGTGFAALDTSQGTYSFPLLMKANQIIAAINSTGSGSQLLYLGGDDRVKIAPSGTQGVDIGSSGKTISLNGPPQLPRYTVAGLPTCNSASAGLMAVAIDVATVAYNSVASGGGTNVIPVMCNSTAWTEH